MIGFSEWHDVQTLEKIARPRSTPDKFEPVSGFRLVAVAPDEWCAQGYYAEAELRLYKQVRALYFLMRYDGQQQSSIVAPVESNVGLSRFFVSRITSGFNFAMANGSTLILNHEYWIPPHGLKSVSVFGARWSYAF